MADRAAETNDLGQPVGQVVSGWSPRSRPGNAPMIGYLVRLERLDPGRHGTDLHAANAADPDDARSWTYLPYGPFAGLADYAPWLDRIAAAQDPLFFAVCDARTNRALGLLSLMRTDPANGVIEVGHIKLSRDLARTAAATEAIYLVMARVFDELGYRRLEWKCDALNAPSRAAAERLGFRFEGIFEQAVIVKGRNRDTAWYALLDRDWPRVRAAMQAWLSPDNIGSDGKQPQRRRLAEIANDQSE